MMMMVMMMMVVVLIMMMTPSGESDIDFNRRGSVYTTVEISYGRNVTLP